MSKTTDWETTPPPMGEEIEFETDAGEIRRGKLNVHGQLVLGSGRELDSEKATDQFIVDGPKPTVAEIRRWRRVQVH